MKAALISLGSVSSRWTAKAMRKYFSEVDEIDLKAVEVAIGSNGVEIICGGEPLKKYDCVYAKGSFRYAQVLSSLTSALYSSTFMPLTQESFTWGHDKFLTHLALQRRGIPMPKTYISSTAAAARKLLNEVGYPIVVKLPAGTGGKGVMFADSFASASSLLDTLVKLNQPFIIQEYIETGGCDIRAIVVGDHVVAAYKRMAVSGEKRANIHAGGHGEPFEPGEKVRSVAVATAKAIGADICGVDILEGAKGPLIIEVNLSPGLQGVTKTSKVDVADKIAKYLYERTKKVVDASRSESASKMLGDIDIEKRSSGSIVASLDMRSGRIFLPKVATDMSGLKEGEDVVIKVGKKSVSVSKE